MSGNIFGRVGDQLYVNSADNHGWSFLYDHFPAAIDDGNVDMTDIHAMVCEQEAVGIDDLVVGRIAIRKQIEDCGKRFRSNRKPYTKRNANNLYKKASFIGQLQVSSDYSIPWTTTNSLDHFVGLESKAGIDEHRKAALKTSNIITK